ncbi:hypothetical protein Tco_0801412 [Tanacetum coccineum]|uniref:Uncharacterized protein n=1 Tax=Tanacetum coccineum TaxID=301880 RepID=A0ABQ4ZVW8_9ASTR
MIIEEAPKKSKEQILQEEASLARLDTLQKEEEAKQVHLYSLLAQRLAEEEELNEDWDLIRAKIEANTELSNSMLGSDLQGEDFAKKMVDLVNQRKIYFAEERARAKRNKPMTQSELRTYMMNYLKNQVTWKLSQLKNLSFEEVKEEFDKLVKQVESFAPINFEATKDSLKRFGEELQAKTSKRLKNEVSKQDDYVSGAKIPVNPVHVAMKSPSIATYKIIKQGEKDERKIKEMNEGASDPDKKKKIVKEDVSAKVPAKQDVAEQGTKKRKGGHMKMIARKRKRPQPDVDSDDEHRKCLKIVTFEGTIDSEIMERKSFISKLDKVSSPEGDYLVVYRVNGNFRAFNYLMEVLHIFDRQDLFHLYDLVMKQYSESTPEGIELILWGDLKIMMESSIEVTDQGDFWNDQQDWEIVTWRLYEACGVCILEFKDGTVIHMLVERKYPLSKELLQRMLDFGLEVEVESTAALDLIRVLNSPCFMVKSWLVQDQTVLGKDYSNLLIADSLLKTIWFINAPCYGNEALASPKANELTIPEQTATGKGISNPLMADDHKDKECSQEVLGYNPQKLNQKKLEVNKPLNIMMHPPSDQGNLKSRGSIEDFVSFREIITSQLQGKLWLYDEVRTIKIRKEEGLLNDEVSSNEEWEEQEYENPPKDLFFKPCFEMDKNNHNENNRNTYKMSGMDLSGAPQSENINDAQPNEGLCRVENFEVIKYTIGDNEEFLSICTRECNSWERIVNGVSTIYHENFRKKDEGWTDLAETMICCLVGVMVPYGGKPVVYVTYALLTPISALTVLPQL